MQKEFFGTVIHGLGQGKKFGFPTINIKLSDSDLHIDTGVYVSKVTIQNQSFNGMLYVGTRPTFELCETTVEIHLLDYDENLYGRQISFRILQKIRHEIHFDTVDQLVEQLHQDKEMVYKYFQNTEG